jgi:hypothetical protein
MVRCDAGDTTARHDVSPDPRRGALGLASGQVGLISRLTLTLRLAVDRKDLGET